MGLAPVEVGGCFFLLSGWSPFGGISRGAGSRMVMGRPGMGVDLTDSPPGTTRCRGDFFGLLLRFNSCV